MDIYQKICPQCSSNVDGRSDKIFCSRSCKSTHRKKPYKKYKKMHCEKCDFIPKHMCQLDVDHIDGNKKNNEILNLQTLCANCHRLKTHINKDSTRKIYR